MAKDKKVNSKKIKEPNYRSEDSNEVFRFLVILGVILIIVLVIYITSVLVEKNRDTSSNTNNETVNTEISYDVTSVGTILNRPYDNYYVMVYNAKDTEAFYYSSLITSYKNVKDAKKIYFCDLSSPFNADYAKETSNPNAKSIEEFAFGKITLLEIKDGKVARYIEQLSDIKEILK